MDTIPITGVDELDRHLNELLGSTELPLNVKLFDHVQLQLTEGNIPPLIPRFLPRLIDILQQDARDPSAPANLCIRLLGPISFTQAVSLASEESLIHALRSPEPSINLLAMTVLHKAAASPDDAAALANRTNLVAELVRRWLLSPHAQIGANGRRVLGDLLDVDCPLPPPPESSPVVQMQMVRRRATGHGAIWRLLFRDRDMYRLLIDIVSGRHRETGGEGNDKGGQRSHQLSLAQGRLLDILPRLAALDFATVSSSDFPAGTPVHATNGGGVHSPSDGQAGDVVSGGSRHDGLLQFAALRMIDKRDMIMHLTLIEFFEGFLSLMRVTEHTPYKLETIRALLREATADDERLRAALDTLPDRTVPEEAEELRSWLQEVLPRRPVQLVGHRF